VEILMPRSAPVDGFRISYERTGSGPTVVLLHGWPGSRADYRFVAPLLTGCDVITVDLRGFGASDKLAPEVVGQYGATAQARGIIGLLRELAIERVVLAGYDIGSRVAQAVAGVRPDLVTALVVAPPLPGAGNRVLTPGTQREFWYQAFHKLPLAEQLIDGKPDAVDAYLRHIWSHWSGPGFEPEPEAWRQLVAQYAEPGSFTASIAWYRAGSGTVARALAEEPPAPGNRLATPTTVLWPDQDPLFPREWSKRLGEFFSAVTVRPVDGTGHFIPLESPEVFASAVMTAVRDGQLR
jgi:pimeloyl-ACP methyl ester carboxylesterase